MTADQVKDFVDGCKSPSLSLHVQENSRIEIDYPSYELYTDTLREGVFKQQSSDSSESREGRQLRLIVNVDRRVKEVIRI